DGIRRQAPHPHRPDAGDSPRHRRADAVSRIGRRTGPARRALTRDRYAPSINRDDESGATGDPLKLTRTPIRVPSPGAEWIAICPPTKLTRSRMLTRPMPPLPRPAATKPA